jgi:hypothetical protein
MKYPVLSFHRHEETENKKEAHRAACTELTSILTSGSSWWRAFIESADGVVRPMNHINK